MTHSLILILTVPGLITGAVVPGVIGRLRDIKRENS